MSHILIQFKASFIFKGRNKMLGTMAAKLFCQDNPGCMKLTEPLVAIRESPLSLALPQLISLITAGIVPGFFLYFISPLSRDLFRPDAGHTPNNFIYFAGILLLYSAIPIKIYNKFSDAIFFFMCPLFDQIPPRIENFRKMK